MMNSYYFEGSISGIGSGSVSGNLGAGSPISGFGLISGGIGSKGFVRGTGSISGLILGLLGISTN
jgi:hypothetical protein